MNANEILGHSDKWESITRQEAVRHSFHRTVVVLYSAHGSLVAVPFTPGSRFHRANGPYAFGRLRYFLSLQEHPNKSIPRGGNRPTPPQPTDLPAQSEPVDELMEPTKKPAEIKITKLDCESFAPLMDTVLIHYEITGELNQAKSVHLRIASQNKADKYILDKQLDGAPQAKGIFMWDGSVTDGDFQGCLNLIGSPYWVQLGLAAPGGSPVFTNKVAIKVELMQTELTVGDKFGLGEDPKPLMDMVASMNDDLKKTPGKAVIHLPGSFFKQDSNEMYTGASYVVYKDALGKGLPVPLFVTLWIKGKDGGKKRSAPAVAGTRILWDTLPGDEGALDGSLSDRTVGPAAKKFIKKISVYKHAETEPPGVTAHWELGGMRANKRDRLDDQKHWEELSGDWKAATPAKRGWSAFTVCAKEDRAMADSGIIYHNGRIAGDGYRVTAYVDLDAALDDAKPAIGDGLPAERKSQTLALQNWRDVRLTKSYKIGAATTALNFDGANQEYVKGALSILPTPGLLPEEIQDRWKSEYRDMLIILSGNSFIKDAAKEDPGSHPTAFLTFEEYWEKTNDPGFFGKLWHRIKAFFGAVDDDGYKDKCDAAAYKIYPQVAQAFPLGANGLTVFKFEKHGEHNLQIDTFTLGIAPSIDGYTSRTQAVLFIFAEGQAVGTVIHEMGHNLFLPHAPGHWEAGKNPGGYEPKVHDKDQICIMSYHPDAKHFCGLCHLRMGGWDNSRINNDGTVTDMFALE